KICYFYHIEDQRKLSKNDLLVLTYYSSFTDFKMKIGQYFRSKIFNMNIRNYLRNFINSVLYFWAFRH
ncbi:MAG: hypothetical protein WBL88_01290, partial [Nitrososphaeraceae archaeon]